MASPRFCHIKDLLVSILIICFIRLGLGVQLSVLDYGAVGDGKTDDSPAFLKAWQELCNSADSSTLEIPEGKTFLLQPLEFQGPCKSTNIHFQVRGSVIAPEKVEDWSTTESWIRFSEVSGLIIDGNGVINGRGQEWWRRLSLGNKISKPRALFFHACDNLQVRGLNHVDSPGAHISIHECHGSTLSNLRIQAPQNSPNTDGIIISGSSHIRIDQSSIGTGDDCIAIKGGSSFINVSGIDCGPGHGISIGSLGLDGVSDTVEEVHVQHCNITGAQNGVRIKTWEGGNGYARKITFENINLVGTKNPIIVDQHYVDKATTKIANGDGVKVSDVTYRFVQGTSASEVAIKFDCANIGCTNIVTENIEINSANPGKSVSASCSNAQGTSSSTTPDIPWQ